MKQKLDRPAPARDLYTSALFQKARGHAERAGELWFILSAEHGLVSPTQEIAPYERSLSKQPTDYRQTWGARVVQSLQTAVGDLAGKVIEVHAGAAYADPIRQRLIDLGAHVVEPLDGLPIGSRLAWYRNADTEGTTTGPGPDTHAEAAQFIALLSTGTQRSLLKDCWQPTADA